MNATSTIVISKETSKETDTEVAPSEEIETFEFNGRRITLDHSRDANLTPFGKKTLDDRYLLPGETYQSMFGRVACAYADDDAHAQRLYDYMSKLWFMPATPVLSNGGANRGLPISCFLNAVPDSLEGITNTWMENVALASNGGGIGTFWGHVRSIGEPVRSSGQTSGIIPFIGVMDRLTLAISQGSLRRGSAAAYLDISHPEVEEFLEIRKASGDFNRKALNLHQGLVITDAFMNAVRNDEEFPLRSPRTKQVVKTINARTLFQKILETRLQTGEPYLVFSDTVNRHMSAHQRKLGLSVTTSNLCSEIFLHTGADHLNNERTAVCCLSSINVETLHEWFDQVDSFVLDLLRFLDNVLEDFIKRAPDTMARAKYSAMRERSVGLGVMGWHSFLQSEGIPFESALAKSWNMRIFKAIREAADAASVQLAHERGPCPDAADAGVMERFSHKMAIAPTASISIICGGTSPAIEPLNANIFTQKTLSGSFTVKNKYLTRLLESRGANTPEIWGSIIENQGSVVHLGPVAPEEAEAFQAAFDKAMDVAARHGSPIRDFADGEALAHRLRGIAEERSGELGGIRARLFAARRQSITAEIEAISGDAEELEGALARMERILSRRAVDIADAWRSVVEHHGDIRHLAILTEDEVDVFKTAFEIDQRWIIEQAADRAPYICQGQSINLFLPGDVDKWDLLMLHWKAWESGVKSLYYCRSKSVQRAAYAGGVEADNTKEWPERKLATERTDYDECLACQ